MRSFHSLAKTLFLLTLVFLLPFSCTKDNSTKTKTIEATPAQQQDAVNTATTATKAEGVFENSLKIAIENLPTANSTGSKVNVAGISTSTSGSNTSITFSNFSFAGFSVGGTYTLTPALVKGAFAYKVTITSGVIQFPGSQAFKYSGTEYFQPVGTSLSITGNFKLQMGTGLPINGTITKPLMLNAGCPNISSGTITFVYLIFLRPTLDFGDGTCDDQAKLSLGALSENVTI